MDEPFLPWWLMLLLAMWAIALTVWQFPAIHREIRLWAGLSVLVYLGLIFVALGLGPRSDGKDLAISSQSVLMHVGMAICIAISLTAGVGVSGRVSPTIRRLCYVGLTLANAGACALLQAPEISITLVLVAILAARPLVRDWGQFIIRPRQQWRQVNWFSDEPVTRNAMDQYWLMGAVNAILACLVIGTLAYSLRYETSRTVPSPRRTALPSLDQLERIHSASSTPGRDTGLLDLAFGERSDVVVLIAVIVFLCLAMSRHDSPVTAVTMPTNKDDSPRADRGDA